MVLVRKSCSCAESKGARCSPSKCGPRNVCGCAIGTGGGCVKWPWDDACCWPDAGNEYRVLLLGAVVAWCHAGYMAVPVGVLAKSVGVLNMEDDPRRLLSWGCAHMSCIGNPVCPPPMPLASI